MGNRAVIAFRHEANKCVYVHWNGGRASIEGFLRAASLCQIEASAKSLHELIKGFLGGSAYLENFDRADKDNGDNGLYYVNEKFEIVGRAYIPKYKQHVWTEEVDTEKTQAIAVDCIAAYNHWPV